MRKRKQHNWGRKDPLFTHLVNKCRAFGPLQELLVLERTLKGRARDIVYDALDFR